MADSSITVDVFDFKAAIDVIYDRLQACPHLARRIEAALVAIEADEPGWLEDSFTDGVLRLDAGPKLVTFCTELIEGRA